MNEYHVQITDAALEDMDELYEYIAYKLLAPEIAIGQYNRIADEILKLSVMPERCHIMDVEPWKTRELRRMNVDNYSVFYKIVGKHVIVTDVLYSASDIETRLRGE